MYNTFCFFRPDGVVVPMGTSKDTGISNPMGYTLNYNGKCTSANIFQLEKLSIAVYYLVFGLSLFLDLASL